MSTSEIQSLVRNDIYQVYFLMSSAALPLVTFRHPWVVINEMGILSRYEIRHTRNADRTRGHLHINAQPPFQGIPLFYYINSFFQPTTLLKLVEGTENSLAKQIIDFIKASPRTYPLRNNYSFLGPNCGTYVEWILDRFPEVDARLPWTAVGKNYIVAE